MNTKRLKAFLASFTFLFAFVLAGCNSLAMSQSAQDMADEQIGSGEVVMPTSKEPVSLGSNGMMYVYCPIADGGCFGTYALVFAGTSPNMAMNWDPAQSPLAFGMYTAPDGSAAFVTQFPNGVAGRGSGAEPDADNVDWANTDGGPTDGTSDGWLNLPTANGIPYIETVSDCGDYHPNIVFGWDEDGNIDIPANVATYGQDYCDVYSADTAE